MELSSNRSIVNCGLTSAHETCTLSLSSSTEDIKRYFKAILELSKLDVPYPVNLESCWMLCYSAKEKAVRALKENFIESVDYQVLAKNGENPKGGRPTIEYHLSVSCLEYFIARKVRPVFDVYRKVFHKTAEVVPQIAKICQSDRKRILELEKELKTTKKYMNIYRNQLEIEKELKNSCFSYLVKNGQYHDWEAFNIKQNKKEILTTILGKPIRQTK